ncbi:MAG: PaaI family thioesterase [Micropepsaceae bacterium]
MTDHEDDAPEGFARHTRQSPLTDPWEPLFAKQTGSAVVLGLRVRPAHTNSRGLVHGGLISALADNAMGLSCGKHQPDGTRLLTASLSVDFLGLAAIGQWLSVETEFVKPGRTLSFAQCFVKADGKPVARANASFAVSRPPE